MNMSQNHASLAARHPIQDDQVYGYELSMETKDGEYMATLFAVDADGFVWHRVTRDNRHFNKSSAKWWALNKLPAGASYIGVYAKDQ